MQRKFIDLMDAFVFSILGAIAFEYFFMGLFRGFEKKDVLEPAAVLGAALGMILVFHLILRISRKSVHYNASFFDHSLTIFTFAGSVIGFRCQIFFTKPFSNYSVFFARLKVFSLILLLGMLLVFITVHFFKRWLIFRSEEAFLPSIQEVLARISLPCIALLIVYFEWGLPAFPTELVASVGALIGIATFYFFNHSTDNDSNKTRSDRRRRIGGFAICAGLVLLSRHLFVSIQTESLRAIVLSVGFLSVAAVGGIVWGAILTERLGTAPTEKLGRPWIYFSSSLVLIIMFTSAAGGLAGNFFGLSKPFHGNLLILVNECFLEPIHRKLSIPSEGPAILEIVIGTIIGGLSGFQICKGWDGRNEIKQKCMAEGISLFFSFWKVAIPAGILAALMASRLFDRFSKENLFLIGLVYGPLVGGSLGLLFRVRHLYKSLSLSEWMLCSLSWVGAVLFAFTHQDLVIPILDIENLISPVLYVTAGFLILLEASNLFRGRKLASDTTGRAPIE